MGRVFVLKNNESLKCEGCGYGFDHMDLTYRMPGDYADRYYHRECLLATFDRHVVDHEQ